MPLAIDTAATLLRFVEDVRIVVPIAGHTLDVEWLPNGRTTLVFRVLEDGHGGDVSVAGPRTRAKFKSATGVARAVLLQFKPGSSSFLGLPANELTDRVVLLQDLWGRQGAELSNELLGTRSGAEALDGIARAIARRSQQTCEPTSAPLVRRAIQLLEGDEVRVERVAKRLGVTARHLRRAFAESVGIGPKEFARTVRLQRAVRRAASRDCTWVRIAVDAGYYDQSHLIADFRELVGLTPSAFVKRASAAATRRLDKGVRMLAQ